MVITESNRILAIAPRDLLRTMLGATARLAVAVLVGAQMVRFWGPDGLDSLT